MPRSKNYVPKYRKHRQSGQAAVTINGRDYLLGPHGTSASKAEYDRRIAEWLASGRSASYGQQQSGVTITELIVDYVRHVEATHGSGLNSELHRVRPILRIVRELYGRTPAADFGTLAYKAIRQRLIDQGLARTNINASMKRIVRFLKWCAIEEKLPVEIPQRLAMIPGLRRGKTDAKESEPVLPVDDRLVEATLPFLPEIVADMVRVQRLTGMRPAEVCQLRPADIDRSGEVWQFTPQRHKTQHHGHKRIVFLGPQAQAVLLRYLARDAETFCFRPCDSESRRRAAASAARRTPMSCGNVPGSNRTRFKRRRPPGDCYNPRSYHQVLKFACFKAFPVPDELVNDTQAAVKWRKDHHWSPNQLRHTAATEIRRQFGLEAAQVALGHSRADITQVYAERDLTLAAHVARQIG
jgi:integrase